ncbi:MAG: aminotransferase class V-fold PLP-dependent enzyme [Candidatus Promineifilaceae bacterium]
MKALVNSADFPAANKSTYLNSASVALMYRGCQTAIDDWNTDLAENGTINFNEHAEQTVFGDLHSAFARLLNATTDDIAVASSATEQLTTLAWAIMPPAGSSVLTTGIVFPTTIYPFTRVARHTGATIRFVPGENGYTDPQKLLDAIDENTSVVCLSHVEFGSGQRYNLRQFADACHANGALLIVDATQSAGAIPIDAPASGADVIISAGYKWLCGPFGASVMYVAPHLQRTLDPGIIGFRSNKDIWQLAVDQQDYPNTAQRFEFSTMAYGCAVGLAKSVHYLADVGVEKIQAHNLKLADRLLEGLDALGAQVVSPRNSAERSSIISAKFANIDSKQVAAHFNQANVIISPRRDLFRFSPHLYNSSDDINHALTELSTFLQQTRA